MTEEKEAPKRNYDNRHRGRENVDFEKGECGLSIFLKA
jgi:hypothetical protein